MAQVKTLHASAAETTTGNSGAQTANGTKLGIGISVTATAGTPTLDLTVEWSGDGENFGAADTTPDAFAQLTAVGSTGKVFDVKAPYYRLVWTIAGTTPSFTFVATSTVS